MLCEASLDFPEQFDHVPVIFSAETSAAFRRKLEEMAREHEKSRAEEERLHKEVRNWTCLLE